MKPTVDVPFGEFPPGLSGTGGFNLTEIEDSYMLSLITKLNKPKATGLDNVPARLLRVCADLIAESPTWIFNASVISGIFPDDLKLSKVFPYILKPANRRIPITIDQYL